MIGSLKADNFLRNNILSKPVNKQQGGPGFGGDLDRLSDNSSWEIKLNFLQLIVLWSVLAGAMIGVFLIGFYTGRDKGISFALENSNIESVRLPVSNNHDVDSALSATQIKLVNQNEGVVEKQPEAKVFDFKAPSENIIESKQIVNNPQPLIANNTSIQEKPQATIITDEPVKAELAPPSQPIKEVSQQKPTALNRGWYSQLAATKSKPEAESIISKMKQKKLSPILEQASIKGQDYYRILIGPFSTKQIAQKESTRAKQTNTFRGEPYIKVVK
ncbi:MAG: SPOR domain-containing protein [Proteobacteria bacterium]|nr:SPOR domain-containing protein [Pseudomonadota bacterium]